MEYINTFIALLKEQEPSTLIIIGGLVFIFLIFMAIIKKIIVGIFTVLVLLAALIFGSYFLFDQAIENLVVEENELKIALPGIEEYSLPLEGVEGFVVTQAPDSGNYVMTVIRNSEETDGDLIVEIPEVVFAVPGTVDKIEEKLLEIPELEPFYEQIKISAEQLRDAEIDTEGFTLPEVKMPEMPELDIPEIDISDNAIPDAARPNYK